MAGHVKLKVKMLESRPEDASVYTVETVETAETAETVETVETVDTVETVRQIDYANNAIH